MSNKGIDPVTSYKSWKKDIVKGLKKEHGPSLFRAKNKKIKAEKWEQSFEW